MSRAPAAAGARDAARGAEEPAPQLHNTADPARVPSKSEALARCGAALEARQPD